MPLPTDNVRVNRTLRKCASDAVGTCYHSQGFALADGTVYYQILRGQDGLEVVLSFPSTASLRAAMAAGPLIHGGIDRSTPLSLHWTYDKFGDCLFSSFKSGAYRDAGAKEWTPQEVLRDSIDEVRRLTGMTVEVARVAAPATTPGHSLRQIVRRIIR